MRLGVYTDNLSEWDLDKAVLLPAALKAGRGDLRWATHALGKWHVGWYYRNFTPTYRGFDTFFGTSGNTGDYWDHTIPGGSNGRCGTLPHAGPRDFIDAVGRNLTVADPSTFGMYDTEVLTARAMRIVAEHPLDQGLYLYLAYHAVHDPQEAPAAAVQQYPRNALTGNAA